MLYSRCLNTLKNASSQSVNTLKAAADAPDDDAISLVESLPEDTYEAAVTGSKPLRPWSVLGDSDPAATRKRVLDLTQRADAYKIGVHAGLFVNAHGDPWTTFGEEAKFVMRDDDQIFGSTKFRENGVSLHHSSFIDGLVAAAGLAVVQDGLPRYFICDSGHYQPTALHMAQFLQRIAEDGVCLTGVRVGFHGTAGDDFLWVTAEDCLRFGESPDLLERAVVGPDRAGKKDKLALSRSSTRSFLSSCSSTPSL